MSKQETTLINKIKKFLSLLGIEIKKTTKIGQRMISASQYNGQINELLQELGELTIAAKKSGELNWNNERLIQIMNTIEELERDIEKIEKEVHSIKLAQDFK